MKKPQIVVAALTLCMLSAAVLITPQQANAADTAKPDLSQATPGGADSLGNPAGGSVSPSADPNSSGSANTTQSGSSFNASQQTDTRILPSTGKTGANSHLGAESSVTKNKSTSSSNSSWSKSSTQAQ